jgi:3-hydroxybutyryl-CoA dehydratase
MRIGLTFADLSLGQAATSTRVVSEQDIQAFADVTGDHNPVHVDAAFAADTPFRQRIAHGLLAAGFISALLGGALPGPGALYVSQSLRFKRPVKIGDTVETRIEVTALNEKTSLVTLACRCSVAGKVVLEGEAVVIPVRRRADG